MISKYGRPGFTYAPNYITSDQEKFLSLSKHAQRNRQAIPTKRISAPSDSSSWASTNASL